MNRSNGEFRDGWVDIVVKGNIINRMWIYIK